MLPTLLSLWSQTELTMLSLFLKAVAKDVNKTPSQVAINWAICKLLVSCLCFLSIQYDDKNDLYSLLLLYLGKGTVPIPGARNLVQAEENLGAVGWSLSNAAVEELDNASAGLSKNMIENIFQTR